MLKKITKICRYKYNRPTTQTKSTQTHTCNRKYDNPIYNHTRHDHEDVITGEVVVDVVTGSASANRPITDSFTANV